MAHSRDGYEETVYGLEGALTRTLEGEVIDVRSGDLLCIPRGAVHRFDNQGDVDAKVLAMVTPGILEPSYVRDLAALLEVTGGGPPDVAAMAGVMRRHGLTPAP